MYKLGFKFWSTNVDYIFASVEGFYRRGLFAYLELFVVPGSRKSLDQWKSIKVPYVLHAPHSYAGFNLSIKECEAENARLLEEVETFRAVLNPRKIIFHPGINGSIDETIRQVLHFKGNYKELFELAVMENKPRVGLKNEVCIGASPEEIGSIINECKLGFCLDIGHTVYFAKWANLKYEDVIEKFIAMKPDIYHLSDGYTNSMVDMHLKLGEGNIDLHGIIKRIPPSSYITIETNKNAETALNDFERDVAYLYGAPKCL